VLRLDDLARALAEVAEAARELVRPAAAAAPPAPSGADGAVLHEALARLLNLLQNNNMKAIDEFQTLQGALSASAGQDAAAALAEAVGTLRFERAAEQVEELLTRRGGA
jgi:hypothetical protein